MSFLLRIVHGEYSHFSQARSPLFVMIAIQTNHARRGANQSPVISMAVFSCSTTALWVGSFLVCADGIGVLF